MHRIKLLLVDDSPTFALTAKQFLDGDARLDVLGIARSGLEALDRVESDRPDIVLMDCHMPGINGLEATRLIKAHSPVPKIIVISLDETPETRNGALAAGADAFLGKSRFGAELPALIQRLAATFPPQPGQF
jgi:DNA-binding NarL/FixJ family response regulator